MNSNNSGKTILIATPAYGGLLTLEYFNGMARLSTTQIDGWKITTKILGNESLIQRARQYLAKIALHNNLDKLLFIDADIGFTGEDVKRLVLHDQAVVGGTYPKKSLPPKLNFNHLETQDISDLPDIKSLGGFRKYAKKFADKNGLVEVCHIPTGFMCIDISVLRKLEKLVPAYSGVKYGLEKFKSIPELFPVKINKNNLESEDWAFCSLCREHGIKIYLDTNVILTHTGNIVIDAHKDYGRQE